MTFLQGRNKPTLQNFYSFLFPHSHQQRMEHVPLYILIKCSVTVSETEGTARRGLSARKTVASERDKKQVPSSVVDDAFTFTRLQLQLVKSSCCKDTVAPTRKLSEFLLYRHFPEQDKSDIEISSLRSSGAWPPARSLCLCICNVSAL